MKRYCLSMITVISILIVGLSLSSSWATEISRDAKRHMYRGQAAMEMAKDATDYQNAVNEFKKAVQYAPNWANAWFNLGVAQEKTEDYAGAIESFNKYLEINPNAADSSEVEGRIYKLEYKQEQKRQKAEAEKKVIPQTLSGNYSVKSWFGGQLYLEPVFEYRGPMPSRYGKWIEFAPNAIVSINGNSIRIDCSHQSGRFGFKFDGTINDNRFRGTLSYFDNIYHYCSKRFSYASEGTIWPEDKVIMIVTESCNSESPAGKRCYNQQSGCYKHSYLLEHQR